MSVCVTAVMMPLRMRLVIDIDKQYLTVICIWNMSPHWENGTHSIVWECALMALTAKANGCKSSIERTSKGRAMGEWSKFHCPRKQRRWTENCHWTFNWWNQFPQKMQTMLDLFDSLGLLKRSDSTVKREREGGGEEKERSTLPQTVLSNCWLKLFTKHDTRFQAWADSVYWSIATYLNHLIVDPSTFFLSGDRECWRLSRVTRSRWRMNWSTKRGKKTSIKVLRSLINGRRVERTENHFRLTSVQQQRKHNQY